MVPMVLQDEMVPMVLQDEMVPVVLQDEMVPVVLQEIGLYYVLLLYEMVVVLKNEVEELEKLPAVYRTELKDEV